MNLNTEFMKKTFVMCIEGVPVTLKITIVAFFVSLILGSLFALIKIRKVKILDQLITVYVSLVRGTPTVLLVLLAYSILPSLFNSFIKKWELGINVWDLDNIIYAYIVFIFSTTAVLTETVRSALLSVDRIQLEAGLSAGLSPFKVYTRIILPQAYEAALPNLCNATISLLKGTSLAFMMSVKEITAIAKTQATYGYDYVEAYLDIFFMYIILCMAIQGIYKVLEVRMNRHRKIAQA